MSARYHLHGLEVASEVPLHAPSGDASLPADVTVVLARDRPPPLPAAEPAAMFGRENGYRVWRQEDGFRLTYPNRADFDVGPTKIAVRALAAPTELLGLFLAGNALSLALVARRELVLHASAVEVEQGVVAFVGSSGFGKSTLAALLCASGLHLVADDVLRVCLDRDQVSCAFGSPEIRLRRAARPVAELLPSWRARESVDGRLVLECPDQRTASFLRLHAVVVPSVAAEGSTLTRLSGAEALVSLLRHPRVLGWRDAGVLELLTRQLAALVRAVPVYAGRLRRGPPFDWALVEELGRMVRAA